MVTGVGENRNGESVFDSIEFQFGMMKNSGDG